LRSTTFPEGEEKERLPYDSILERVGEQKIEPEGVERLIDWKGTLLLGRVRLRVTVLSWSALELRVLALALVLVLLLVLCDDGGDWCSA
jgi:hypothetical protein